MHFFYSHDGRFLLKSLKSDEFVFLQSIMGAYHRYLSDNVNTLINRFYGCYGVEHNGRTLFVVAMESLFFGDGQFAMDAIYDLKGSTKGRVASKKERRRDKVPVLKDVDWTTEGRRIDVGEAMSVAFQAQLAKDAQFLCRLEIIDYSLLLGIHSVDRSQQSDGGERRYNLREVRARDCELASPLLFKHCHGGMLSFAQHQIYFVGVIDILQRFTNKKKVENVLKRIKSKQAQISCAPPNVYADRLCEFVKDKVMR